MLKYLKPDLDYPLYTIGDESGDILSLHITPEAFEEEIPKQEFLYITKYLASLIADIIHTEGE